LWNFLGIPTGTCRAITDNLLNRSGNHPGLERKPRLLSIADPRNLESNNPAIKKAAEVKQQEDMAPQKIKALKYLAKIGCACYPGVKEALMAALDDCTESVRYTAASQIAKAAKKNCSCCNKSCCCDEELTKKLAQVANDRDDLGCFKEPSKRVRDAARQALQVCYRVRVAAPEAAETPAPTPAPPRPPGEVVPPALPGETVPPPPTKPPAAPPEENVAGSPVEPQATNRPAQQEPALPVNTRQEPPQATGDAPPDELPPADATSGETDVDNAAVDEVRPELERELRNAYLEFAALVKNNAQRADLDALGARTRQLLSASQTPVERQRVRLLLSRLEQFARPVAVDAAAAPRCRPPLRVAPPEHDPEPVSQARTELQRELREAYAEFSSVVRSNATGDAVERLRDKATRLVAASENELQRQRAELLLGRIERFSNAGQASGSALR
jgi:hypothetical protein